TVRKILHPAAPSLIAHEYIELAVGPEAHYATVVVAVFSGVLCAGMPRHRDVVRLPCPQHDQVTVKGKRGRNRVPSEAINPVAQQRDLADNRRVGTRRRALGPAYVDEGSHWEIRMQHQAQEAALGIRIHGEV